MRKAASGDGGSQPLLQVKGLDLYLQEGKKERRLLEEVSFCLAPGEVLGIAGESGSGKSILALALVQLLSPAIKIGGGEILYQGQDLLALTDRQMDQVRGRHMAMIYQDALTSLNPLFTVGNQLREALRAHEKMSRKEAQKQALELLERVGMPQAAEVMKAYPHSLSGGMRQRVMIAMAMAARPEILIADEATTALDVTVQAQIMSLIRDLVRESGASLILISHDLGLVAQMADRIMILYAGQLVEVGPREDLFCKPAHPYTQALLQAVPSITDPPDQPLKAIPGLVPQRYGEIRGCHFANRCPRVEARCCQERQGMVELATGHQARCFKAQGGPA